MTPADNGVRSFMIDALTHTATGVLCLKCCVGLVAKPFTPNREGILPVDPFPTWTGYEAKERGAVDAQVLIDPITGRLTVFIPPPVGGWKFVCGSNESPPITVYGYYYTVGVDKTDPQSPVFGSDLFDQPISITTIGEYILIPEVKFEMQSVYMV